MLLIHLQGFSRQSSQLAASQEATQLLQTRVRAAALRIFLAVWPWIHAGCEGAAFAYNLAFLLDASPMHHPLLHLLQSRLVRVSAQDMVSGSVQSGLVGRPADSSCVLCLLERVSGLMCLAPLWCHKRLGCDWIAPALLIGVWVASGSTCLSCS